MICHFTPFFVEIDKEFVYSNGWLARFKSRHEISSLFVSGESNSVNPQFLAEAIVKLNGILSEYAPENVYNFDETGLFYKLVPSR